MRTLDSANAVAASGRATRRAGPQHASGLQGKPRRWLRFVAAATLALATLPALAFPVNDFTIGSGEALAARISGSGVTPAPGSATLVGPNGTASMFSSLDAGSLPAGTRLVLPAGILLSVGNAVGDLAGDTNAGFCSESVAWVEDCPPANRLFQGDADLLSFMPLSSEVEVTDSASLAFDFSVPAGADSVSFDLIFASQEGIPNSLAWDRDIAVVLIDGSNAALIDGHLLRVTADAPLVTDVQLDPGLSSWWALWSRPVTVTVPIDPTRAQHAIKIAVGNTTDHFTPSAIFVANLRANVAVQTWRLDYDGNGSTGGSAPVDPDSPYVSGSSVTVLGNSGRLARTGYAFSGWNTAAGGGGTTYAAGQTFAIVADTTLYAAWTVVPPPQPVPALQGWAVLLAAVMLGGVGALFLRRPVRAN